jgi:membrane protease YdiL (CAAX protease family)
MTTLTPPPVVPVSEGKIRDLSALILAMTFPSLMAWLYFMVLPGEGSQNNPFLKWTFGLAKFVQFAFPVVFVFLTDRRQLRMAPVTWRGMGLAVGFGVATAAAICVLYFLVLKSTGLFETTAEKVRLWMTQFSLTTLAGFLIMAGFVSLFHSLLEEYYWRWFVFGRLRRQVPWGWAAVISGLAFMSHHVILLAFYFPGRFWPVAVPFSLGVAAGGMVWAWIYQRSGSIYANWASHCLIDLALMAVGYDLMFST